MPQTLAFPVARLLRNALTPALSQGRGESWTSFLPIVLLLIGLAVGGGAVWLLLRAKIQHAYDRGKSEADAERIVLSERLAARDQTIDGLDAKVQELEGRSPSTRPPSRSCKPKSSQLATTLIRNANRPRRSWPS